MNAVEQNVTHETGEEHPKSPFWLKMLVTVLGLAIIGMLGLIIFKIVAGDHQKETLTDLPSATIGSVQHQPLPPHGDHQVTIPQGGQLIEVQPNGVELMLRIKLVDGSEKILFLNRTSGVVTTVEIQEES
jgi:hypothetical protein